MFGLKLQSRRSIVVGERTTTVPLGESGIKNIPSQSSTITRWRSGLTAARDRVGRGLGDLLLGKRTLDDTLLEELEAQLLAADIGVPTTTLLLKAVTDGIARKSLANAPAVYAFVRQHILDLVRPCAVPLSVSTAQKPFTIMVVGVNGVGKTTTMAKLANRFVVAGHRVMLAAGDTFRAAAVEQLKIWGARLDTPVIAQQPGADAAAVAHDAMEAARARGSDVLLIDTAGRQHTHTGLMEELKKITRVIAKADASAPHEVLMILDTTTGQNALSQLAHFREAVGVTGLCLTKLDGTAKGGIVVAIARATGLPIRFVGFGETIDDLAPFDAEAFVDAILPIPGKA